MRARQCAFAVLIGIGLLLSGGPQMVFAQPGGYAPPPPPLPPPPPPAPDAVSPAPTPTPVGAAEPAPTCARRPRYRPSSWGRFYLGAGGGYLFPGGELGDQLQPGGAYGAWMGWRRGWLGFELGYLGAHLAFDLPDSVIISNDAEPTQGSYVTYSAPEARLSQFTGDVKLFFRLFCSSTLFARFGANYTELDLAGGPKYTGIGYQYGAGLDYRIRLGFRPDLILKLRAEVLRIHADLALVDVTDRRNLSGVYMMLYVNLGWSPR